LDLLSFVIPFAIVLGSLTVHEAAHAWSADRLGDPTARMLGRTSLNPVVHIDLIGTIVLPVVAVLSNLPIIGWAKPVPVNINRLHQPRRDFMLVAAAGPASNLVLATFGAIAIRGTLGAEGLTSGHPLVQLVLINVLLAVFNLVPVPPLDGGNVLAGLLPPSAADVFARLRPYGFLILYALVLTDVLSMLILPPAFFLVRLLLP
jgi:Zn-dependent protease